MKGMKMMVMDSCPLARMAMRQLFSTQGYKITGEQDNFMDLLKDCIRDVPHIILLEHLQQPLDPLVHISFIKEFEPKVKVLVFSASTSRYDVLQSQQNGIDGYLSKHASLEKLNEVTERVLAGERCFPSVARPTRMAQPDDSERLAMLTPKELSILRMIYAGCTNLTIASKLKITNKVASAYKISMMKKINASRLPELIDFARRNFVY